MAAQGLLPGIERRALLRPGSPRPRPLNGLRDLNRLDVLRGVVLHRPRDGHTHVARERRAGAGL